MMNVLKFFVLMYLLRVEDCGAYHLSHFKKLALMTIKLNDDEIGPFNGNFPALKNVMQTVFEDAGTEPQGLT
jgi:hypothetical protein